MSDNLKQEAEDVFADVTLDETPQGSVTAEEGVPEEKTEAEVETAEDESSEKDESEEGEKEEESKEEKEEKDEKKTSGLENVRKFGERQKARADELEAKLTEVNTKVQALEEFGGVDAVKQVVEGFGGLEQAKVGSEVVKILNDNTSEPDALIERAREYFPETIDALVLHVAETLHDTIKGQVTQKLFGRALTAEEEARVKDFVIYGEAKGDDLPDDMLYDELGNKLPDKVINALKHQREEKRRAAEEIQRLEMRVNQRLSSIESKESRSLENDFMNQSFGVIGAKLEELQLSKPVPGETAEAAQERFEKSGVLNALTFHFYAEDSIADKALTEARSLLGKTDKISVARLNDLSKTIQRRAEKAADKAVRFIAPSIKPSATTKTQVAKQSVSKASTGTSSKVSQSSQSADPFADLTVDNLGF